MVAYGVLLEKYPDQFMTLEVQYKFEGWLFTYPGVPFSMSRKIIAVQNCITQGLAVANNVFLLGRAIQVAARREYKQWRP